VAYSGPTKDDFLTQIAADLKADFGESDEVLKERQKRVKAAGSDAAASKAYFGHLEELRQEAEAPAEPTE
jgi:hypothetical protein